MLQLPLHPSTAWEPTGNIPLASAILAASAALPLESIFPGELLNTLGDTALLQEIKRRDPELLGVTLYMWNRERTLHLLQELKDWKPGLLVVAGGPEVTRDNHLLLSEPSIDLFVAGEGESFASDVLSPEKLKYILESGTRLLGPVVDTDPPDHWPDPYRMGYITPLPGGSVHVETQRGCMSLCSYCAYRRTSPVPRMISADKVLNRIHMLQGMGAGELVFLDPTFNNRPDLKILLEGMSNLGLDCFAEVRSDLIHSSTTTDALARAGFSSLEVGLQTMSTEVLHSIGRGGNPLSILKGASLLKQSGITPIMDLILGLPGDDPANIEQAARELISRNLHEQVQSFCLSVLPGTELRANAKSLGIEYEDKPPYSIKRSGRYSIRNLLQARENVSDILGYDADPPSRPVLSDSFPGMETFSPEKGLMQTSPSVRHGVLHIDTHDAWAHRNSILNKVMERREKDPYCPLDVVIQSDRIFPLDLIDMLMGIHEPQCYTKTRADIYQLPGLLRIAVVMAASTNPDWLKECSEIALTVVKSASAVALPGGQVGLLLEGNHDLDSLSALYSEAPHLIFFTSKELEILWNLEVLGLG
ncbi:MAG: radical SAM protein [Candidatus Fermentibacteria bacterium]|nr:radical SAM protein [Candidatus Fermentibacteria bacterium]